MKILYAEDELGLSMAVSEVLKMEGFEVTSVMDGLSADEILQKEHFDMVVLDIMMPGMEGTQVAENMRKRSDYTPVLLLTAKAETEDRIDGLNKGADDYLAKPFAMGELVARVKAMIRRNRDYQQTVLKSCQCHTGSGEQRAFCTLRQPDLKCKGGKASGAVSGKGVGQLFCGGYCRSGVSRGSKSRGDHPLHGISEQ